jgi:hypothetical protein
MGWASAAFAAWADGVKRCAGRRGTGVRKVWNRVLVTRRIEVHIIPDMILGRFAA